MTDHPRVVRVEPGDQVILASRDRLTAEQADQIRAAWRASMPNTSMVLVTGMDVVCLPRHASDPNPFPVIRPFRWLP